MTFTTSLKEEISKGKDETLKLKIKRNEKYISKDITPVKDINGVNRLGIWVKDSAAGLGTISFISESGTSFAALGHGICDRETGVLIPLSQGEIVKATITSINKSKDSNVGTLNGFFTDETIGKANTNKEIGIYGTCEEPIICGDLLEIANPNEIKDGHALLRCNVSGNEPQNYNVSIIKIDKEKKLKNLIIQITDEELLQKTGGIVQGMSGSPIIQDNKIIGVLTHVLTDDVTKGYAVFAKTMYDSSIN